METEVRVTAFEQEVRRGILKMHATPYLESSEWEELSKIPGIIFSGKKRYISSIISIFYLIIIFFWPNFLFQGSSAKDPTNQQHF